MKILRILLPLLLLAGTCLNAAAEPAVTSLDEAQQVFFMQFRTAVQGHNAKQLSGLAHSESRACISPEDRDYQYGRFLEGLAKILGRQQFILEIGVADVDEELFDSFTKIITEQNMHWPIKPEKQIVVKYSTEGIEDVATIYIARDDGKWKWVHICQK